jgi:hypothetical protein
MIGWKHGKVYKKNWQKNIKFNKGSFSQKHKKVIRFKFYLNFILKLLNLQLGLLQINYKISKNLK